MVKKKWPKDKNPWALCSWVAKKEGWPTRGKKYEECVKSVKRDRIKRKSKRGKSKRKS